jgi:chromosome partitioning protein
MGTVFAVVNQKGGTGKTTTAVNIAACLSAAGKRVLLVDLDPQSNATSGVGIPKTGRLSTYDVLINNVPLGEVIQETEISGLAVAPANLDLAGAEIELMPRLARETVLRESLAGERGKYDFTLIDAPPSLGLLTLNTLVAADSAIVPIQCEYYALEGVGQLMKTIELVRRHLNPHLSIGLVIMTMYDNRLRLNQQVVEEVRGVFKDKVARRVIPRSVRVAEAPSHGLPVVVYDPRSRGAVAYREVAQEILKHG